MQTKQAENILTCILQTIVPYHRLLYPLHIVNEDDHLLRIQVSMYV